MDRIFWLTRTSAKIPADDDWLSKSERIVLAGFRFPKRRNDWLLGRWTAKEAIRLFLAGRNFLLPSLEIRSAADGAPEAFFEGRPAGVSLSISHSRDRSLCVAGSRAMSVSCDLEWIEPREDNFENDYFVQEEISFVAQSPFAREVASNLIWSAKETTLKIIRKGLSRDTRSVVINPEFDGNEQSWNRWTGRCLESSKLFHGWWRTCEGYIYTIASDRPTSHPEPL